MPGATAASNSTSSHPVDLMSPVSSYFLLTAIVITILGVIAYWIGLAIGRRLWRTHRRRAAELRTEIARLRALNGESSLT